MRAQCTSESMTFQRLARRSVVAAFDGGRVSSDGGALLLSEVDCRAGLVAGFSSCFTDHRDASRVEHSVEDLVRQRVFGLCLGYEDVNDHDVLRDDALLATAVGKRDPEGQSRKRERDQGHALAGKSTLNRLELGGSEPGEASRYKRIVGDRDAIERSFVGAFIRSRAGQIPERLVLDFDPTDIELHGEQEGRFFHGYYGHYCYLPLLVFCGEDLLLARLRRANIDACSGTVEALAWLVPQLRACWPHVEIVLRADSGFAREDIFAWCEANRVEYVVGLARNNVLREAIVDELAQARQLHEQSGKPERVFKELSYRTTNSWTRQRRVVAKAEQLAGKSNPRFVVTSYSAERYDARTLYERQYCQRGEMENRIKEQQLDLFGDRASCSSMAANQLRLWLSALAHMLMVEMRRSALAGTELAHAQTCTLRVRLLKIGAVVRLSTRRIRIYLSSTFPLQEIFRAALDKLRAPHAPPA